MTERADVVVVGAGIVGVCAAHALARRGRTVLLLDRGDVAAGCSYGNAGLVCPSHSIPLASPAAFRNALKWMFDPESPFYIRFRFSPALWSWLWRFRRAARTERVLAAIPVLRDLHRASVSEFERLCGRVECAWERKGLLEVYRTEEGLEEGRGTARLLGEHGLPSEMLDAAAVRDRAPCVREGVAGGVLWPEDAHLDPARFVQGLAGLAREEGVRIETGTEVTGLDPSQGIVRTSRGDFRGDRVVLAAGAWSPALARDLDVRLPIQPAKGYSITVRRPDAAPPLPLLLHESKVAVTPMGPILRFAGTLELAGLDLTINERRVGAIRKAASEWLEGTEGAEELQVWRGLRPCTPDGLPVVDRAPGHENVILAAGHAMIGVSLGAVTGRLVAELACGEPPCVDLAPLAATRFL